MMKLSKIAANATYHKCIKDLGHFGYLEYIPSYHPVKGSLINLFNFDTSTEQVNTRNHTKKQSGTEQVHLYSNINSINKENVYTHTLSKNEQVLKSVTSSGVEKPSVEDVKTYFTVKKYPINEAEKFFNYYCSNGWLVGGKTEMKDWRAAARNWMLNEPFKNEPNKQQIKAGQLHATTNKNIMNPYKYDKTIEWLQAKGLEIYGKQFKIYQEDKKLLYQLICYFLKDEEVAEQLSINLEKGILLSGPLGCGKTTLMSLLRFLQQSDNRFIMKPCRDISMEFIRDGFETIYLYSKKSFDEYTKTPKAYCFDDLGIESSLKYFGNECNVIGEVLLSRYDLFVSRKMITHITTNLSASEIEAIYGNRIRSRMREMFNLISFDSTSIDKRK